MQIISSELILQKNTIEINEVDLTREINERDNETQELKQYNVFVREASVAEKEHMERMFSLDPKTGKLLGRNIREKIVVMLACDADRKPIFKTADIEKLSKAGNRIVSKIFDAAMKLNSMRNNDFEEEEELKN